MAPVAFGALAMIAGVVVISAFLGAISGAILWRLKIGLILSAFLVVAGYFLLMVLLDRSAVKAATYFGVFPLLVTFFAGNLTARYLVRDQKLRFIWIHLIALGVASAAGVLYLALFRKIFLGFLDT